MRYILFLLSLSIFLTTNLVHAGTPEEEAAAKQERAQRLLARKAAAFDAGKTLEEFQAEEKARADRLRRRAQAAAAQAGEGGPRKTTRALRGAADIFSGKTKKEAADGQHVSPSNFVLKTASGAKKGTDAFDVLFGGTSRHNQSNDLVRAAKKVNGFFKKL